MTEADEIAESLVATYGNPHATTWDEAKIWLLTVWPAAPQWIGHQMMANVATAILAARQPARLYR